MLKSRLFIVLLLLPVWSAAQHTAAPSAKTKSLQNLRQQLDQYTQLAQGRVGMAATVLETGESVSIRGDERFPMQSVYKFPIGMAVLHQVDQGKVTLDQLCHVDKSEYVGRQQHSPLRDSLPNGSDIRIGDLLRYAVSQSDGSASDVLMHLAGGPMAVMAYLKSLAIRNIRVMNTEKELGQDNAVQYANWATPTDMVSLLKALQQGRGLSPASRAFLLRLMTETPTGPNRLKGLLPPATVVAHKTGSSGTLANLTAATNDVGLITLPNGHHLAIAVFVSDSKADTPTREAVIANLAKVVWEHWR
ncbi:class A beta-lactamase [Fibrella sp. HMF5335]|uniref:Beta-lactamase n=1 Tax=Fibrella rubiginis TaxID=2817060 RepID=A0A939K2L4_9BACT|nr:class A beta-lactamase [Fibrella rubiginis]MBO0938332.1 class A beta-lactamase [Fibrella rubiginis]